MDRHSNSDDVIDDLPSSHPARRSEFGSKHETTNRNRGGWGEAMELAHQKQQSSSVGNSNSNNNPSSVVAVDLNQFRNTEVGSGYQAKHVVRQKKAAVATTTQTIVNNNNNSNFQMSGGNQKSNKGFHEKAIETEELLKNDGLRAFRREIESILSS